MYRLKLAWAQSKILNREVWLFSFISPYIYRLLQFFFFSSWCFSCTWATRTTTYGATKEHPRWRTWRWRWRWACTWSTGRSEPPHRSRGECRSGPSLCLALQVLLACWPFAPLTMFTPRQFEVSVYGPFSPLTMFTPRQFEVSVYGPFSPLTMFTPI